MCDNCKQVVDTVGAAQEQRVMGYADNAKTNSVLRSQRDTTISYLQHKASTLDMKARGLRRLAEIAQALNHSDFEALRVLQDLGSE
jgi:hypothetical protein